MHLLMTLDSIEECVNTVSKVILSCFQFIDTCFDLVEYLNNLFLFSVTGEAQIAYTNYQQPSMIPAHVVIFDNDTFGVLFLEIGSLALYSRVKENLAATHFEDIFQEI